eukprot:TRINITY_DN74966_c0_g1_i1.p1 TRINITY_DN74966_c0_g1~~TRINITY_DN74966_c0_g1_i1.p1  ORF type:complete len:730 (+),score=176.74 TRINITY_DN74966_c0_g1_i1:83-2272(+)
MFNVCPVDEVAKTLKDQLEDHHLHVKKALSELRMQIRKDVVALVKKEIKELKPPAPLIPALVNRPHSDSDPQLIAQDSVGASVACYGATGDGAMMVGTQSITMAGQGEKRNRRPKKAVNYNSNTDIGETQPKMTADRKTAIIRPSTLDGEGQALGRQSMTQYGEQSMQFVERGDRRIRSSVEYAPPRSSMSGARHEVKKVSIFEPSSLESIEEDIYDVNRDARDILLTGSKGANWTGFWNQLSMPAEHPVEGLDAGSAEMSVESEKLLFEEGRRSSRERQPLIDYDSAEESDPERWVDYCLFNCIDDSVRRVVSHPGFELVCGCMVILNAAFMGVEAGGLAPHNSLIKWVNLMFCIIFTLELALRIHFHSFTAFYCGETWMWALFDTIMVGLQIWSQLSSMLTSLSHGQYAPVSGLRMLRMLRVARLTRLFRMFPMFSMVANSMLSSLSPTICSLTVLAMIVYAGSVIFVQALKVPCAADEDLDQYFGTLSRSGFTLVAAMTGGLDWDSVLRSILATAGPGMGVSFLFYLSFTAACFISMMLGIILDAVTKTVREDKDTSIGDRIKDLFQDPDDETRYRGGLTWEDFAAKLEHPAMIEYFRAIDVEPTEEDAKCIFELLDEDGGGTLDSSEMVSGCLRLRGPARALDMSLLIRDVLILMKETDDIIKTNTRIETILLENRTLSMIAGGGAQKSEPAEEDDAPDDANASQILSQASYGRQTSPGISDSEQ